MSKSILDPDPSGRARKFCVGEVNVSIKRRVNIKLYVTRYFTLAPQALLTGNQNRYLDAVCSGSAAPGQCATVVPT